MRRDRRCRDSRRRRSRRCANRSGHPQSAERKWIDDPRAGYVFNHGDNNQPNYKSVGFGAAFDASQYVKTIDLHDDANGGHVYLMKPMTKDGVLVSHHHLAAIWDGDGQINNQADFEKYLQRWAKLLNDPVKVVTSDARNIGRDPITLLYEGRPTPSVRLTRVSRNRCRRRCLPRERSVQCESPPATRRTRRCGRTPSRIAQRRRQLRPRSNARSRTRRTGLEALPRRWRSPASGTPATKTRLRFCRVETCACRATPVRCARRTGRRHLLLGDEVIPQVHRTTRCESPDAGENFPLQVLRLAPCRRL